MLELNVCLIPPKNISQHAISLSQQFSKKYETQFTLDNKHYIPHISLYHFPIPKHNLKILTSTLEEIANSHQSLILETTTLSTRNYLWWNINKTHQLEKLHTDLLKKINPLRENLQRIKIDNSDQGFTNQQKMYIKKYAYPLVESEFVPHITITGFKDQHTKHTLNIISRPDKNFTFSINKLTLGTIGAFGNLPKIIKEFRLK